MRGEISNESTVDREHCHVSRHLPSVLSAAPLRWMQSLFSRLRRPSEFGRPAIVVNVVSHHIGSYPHPLQNAGEVRRLDQTCDEPVDHIQMSGVSLRLEVKTPFRHIRVEIVDPSVVFALEAFDMMAIPMRANGKLSQVAERRKRVRQRFPLLTAVDVLDDLVPKHAPTVLPPRIFLIEPSAFRPGDAGVGLPENSRTPEPHSKVQ